MTALNEIFCMIVMFVLGQVTAQLLMRNAQVVDTRYLFFFFQSFIGCSSSDVHYKFVIQHTHTHTQKEKKKEAKKPKRGRCNETNVPCEAPPLD